jgi:GMP reductase
MPELYISEEKTFDYDDIMLIPTTGVVKSRSEVDVTAELGGRKFTSPVIPANMSTIVDETTVEWLAERGYFYVMHRFDVDAVSFTKNMHDKGYISSISLGIKPVDYETVERFIAEDITPEYITIDVAHGDSEEVFKMVSYVKRNLETFLIAGNVATAEAARKLAEAGADAIKVGVAPGSVCLTGPNTGFGSRGWQLSAVAHVAEQLKDKNVKIIADGGIRKYGDIAKSVAFGADFIMIGGMFAGHDENPGELLDMDGVFKKAFFGSASEHQKGEEKHVEGLKTYVPYKGSLDTTLRIIRENLQSSVSYAGGRKLLDLHNVRYVKL